MEDNPVFAYLDAFDSDVARVTDLKRRYARTGVGNRELKDRLEFEYVSGLCPYRAAHTLDR